MIKKNYFALLLLSTPLFAVNQLPPQCRVSGLQFTQKTVSLFSQHTAKPRLYAIENIGKKPIWITHTVKNPSASAGWSSQLMPHHWSVLLVTQRNFDLGCRWQSKSGKMQAVSCQSFLHICQYSDFKSAYPIDAGYWAVENVLFSQLSQRLNARGIAPAK